MQQLLLREISLIKAGFLYLALPYIINIIMILVFSHLMVMRDRCIDHDPSHPGHQRTLSLEMRHIHKYLYEAFLQYILRFSHTVGIPHTNPKELPGIVFEKFPLGRRGSFDTTFEYGVLTAHFVGSRGRPEVLMKRCTHSTKNSDFFPYIE